MYNKYKFLFISLLILGLIYRLYLGSLAISSMIWDMGGYVDGAGKMLEGKLTYNCCYKNNGYPAILAIIYMFFGINNLTAVRIIQALIDVFIALLIYKTAHKLWGEKPAAWAFLLYLLNPWTASFTGLVLPEIFTIFFIIITGYLLTLKKFLRYQSLWFVFGFLLGIIVFIRLSFLNYSLILILLFSLFIFKKKHKVVFGFLAMLGFVLASSYSIMTNYIHYKKFSVTPPYVMQAGHLYLNFFITDHQPEVAPTNISHQYSKIVDEYWQTPITLRPKLSEKYQQLFFQKLASDWPLFLRNIGRNILWLWDKDHLYTYKDPFYPADQWLLRSVNLLLIIIFIYSLSSYIFINGLRQPFALFTLSLFAYMTLIFPLVSNESRHTLAFYGLMMIWAGYGLGQMRKKIIYNKK